MSIITILYLLFLHWLADFLFQTTEMATQKWENDSQLLKHTFCYSVIMTFGLVFLLNVPTWGLATFFSVTFLCHTIQDYITSKMTHKQFEKKIFNGWTGGFTIIGLDQWFHYLQIFLTYLFITT